jgi:hypothetical protein
MASVGQEGGSENTRVVDSARERRINPTGGKTPEARRNDEHTGLRSREQVAAEKVTGGGDVERQHPDRKDEPRRWKRNPGGYRPRRGCNTPRPGTDSIGTQSPEGATSETQRLRSAGQKRGNVERVSPGDEPGRVSKEGNTLKGKPHERQWHETRPRGTAGIKPSRT